MANKLKISFLGLGLIFAAQSTTAKINFSYSIDLNKNAKHVEEKIKSLNSSFFRKDLTKDALDVERLASVMNTYNTLSDKERKEFSTYCNNVALSLTKHAKRSSGKRIFHKSSQYYKNCLRSVMSNRVAENNMLHNALNALSNENREQDFLLNFANIIHQDLVDSFWKMADEVDEKLSLKLPTGGFTLGAGLFMPNDFSIQNTSYASQVKLTTPSKSAFFSASNNSVLKLLVNKPVKSQNKNLRDDILATDNNINIDSADGTAPTTVNVTFGSSVETPKVTATNSTYPINLYSAQGQKTPAGFIVGAVDYGKNIVRLRCQSQAEFDALNNNVSSANREDNVKCGGDETAFIEGYGNAPLNLISTPGYYTDYHCGSKKVGIGYKLNFYKGSYKIGATCSDPCVSIVLSNECLTSNKFLNVFYEEDTNNHYQFVLNAAQGNGPNYNCDRLLHNLSDVSFGTYNVSQNGCDIEWKNSYVRAYSPANILGSMDGGEYVLLQSGEKINVKDVTNSTTFTLSGATPSQASTTVALGQNSNIRVTDTINSTAFQLLTATVPSNSTTIALGQNSNIAINDNHANDNVPSNTNKYSIIKITNDSSSTAAASATSTTAIQDDLQNRSTIITNINHAVWHNINTVADVPVNTKATSANPNYYAGS